jgi:peptidoglycan hydrolase-like protein with peptidoglycan-binding domain
MPGRRGRVAVASTVAVVVAVVAVVAGTAAVRKRRTVETDAAPAATAAIVRQTLVESATVVGEVGYGTAVPVDVRATGTVTWVPEQGATLARGSQVARVDDGPVVLLYGALPMYRPLGAGAEGHDVGQLTQNLKALGYTGFAANTRFTAATATAVRRWQRDLGLPESGVVEVGRVVFTAGPVRVATVSVRPGAAAPAQVLAVTATTRIVSANALAGTAAWAGRGARVTVRLQDGRVVPGVVTATATATSAGASGQPAEGGGAAEGARGNGVRITVELTGSGTADVPEQTGVEVTHVLRRRVDVLTVPVAALLALAEGGYGVEVVEPAGTRVVAVKTGLFADGRVEISGDGLREGQHVGMPA